jgi:hypothetical protein
MKTAEKKSVPKKARKLAPSREQEIRQEIFVILHDEASKRFNAMAGREETLQKRLDSIERAGVPEGTLEEIKREISGLKYIVNKQTRAIESLLSFFNASKGFLTMDEQKKN